MLDDSLWSFANVAERQAFANGHGAMTLAGTVPTSGYGCIPLDAIAVSAPDDEKAARHAGIEVLEWLGRPKGFCAQLNVASWGVSFRPSGSGDERAEAMGRFRRALAAGPPFAFEAATGDLAAICTVPLVLYEAGPRGEQPDHRFAELTIGFHPVWDLPVLQRLVEWRAMSVFAAGRIVGDEAKAVPLVTWEAEDLLVAMQTVGATLGLVDASLGRGPGSL